VAGEKLNRNGAAIKYIRDTQLRLYYYMCAMSVKVKAGPTVEDCGRAVSRRATRADKDSMAL